MKPLRAAGEKQILTRMIHWVVVSPQMRSSGSTGILRGAATSFGHAQA
jgi:hypothetical protein